MKRLVIPRRVRDWALEQPVLRILAALQNSPPMRSQKHNYRTLDGLNTERESVPVSVPSTAWFGVLKLTRCSGIGDS